jgi:quercetin dioxygenase-like cupin family protein
MPMKPLFLAPLLLMATDAAAQTTGGAIVVHAEQVEQIRQAARASQGTKPSAAQPIISAQPYVLNLEHRTGKTGASVHTAEAEVIIVLDGAATVTTGGSLVDATPEANGNISGKDIAGGTAQHAVKGDMLMVPQGVPHMMVPDGDTILSLAPYRVGLEYRTPKAIASVHKNDGEFMLVLEGEGVIVTGGTVVNPKDLGANIDGDAIQGGTDNRMKKGDWIFVPKGLPHLARTDGTFVLATLHVTEP